MWAHKQHCRPGPGNTLKFENGASGGGQNKRPAMTCTELLPLQRKERFGQD